MGQQWKETPRMELGTGEKGKGKVLKAVMQVFIVPGVQGAHPGQREENTGLLRPGLVFPSQFNLFLLSVGASKAPAPGGGHNR